MLLHPIEAQIRRYVIRKLEVLGSSSSKLLVSNKRDSIEQGLPTKPKARMEIPLCREFQAVQQNQYQLPFKKPCQRQLLKLGIWATPTFCFSVIVGEQSRFSIGKCIPNWQEKILLIDQTHPSLKDCTYHSLFVPKFVNSHVNKLAILATTMPIHSYMVNQNFL